MAVTVLMIFDTEWPAILAAGILGMAFALIRSYRHKRKK